MAFYLDNVEKNEPEKAIENLARAVEFITLALLTDNLLEHLRALGFYKLARLYYSIGHTRKTIKYLDESFAIIPNQVMSNMLLRLTFLDCKQFEEAEKIEVIVRRLNGKSDLTGDVEYTTQRLEEIFNLTKKPKETNYDTVNK